MGEKPRYRVAAKSKASGNFANILAIWENEKGASGQLDREVAKIVLANGQVITNENAWINLYINEIKDEHNQDDGVTTAPPQDKPTGQAYPHSAEEVPF